MSSVFSDSWVAVEGSLASKEDLKQTISRSMHGKETFMVYVENIYVIVIVYC